MKNEEWALQVSWRVSDGEGAEESSLVSSLRAKGGMERRIFMGRKTSAPGMEGADFTGNLHRRSGG
jgi:hypothetical protein